MQRHFGADRVEREVDATVRHVVDGLHRIDLRGVHDVRRTELLRELQLLVVQVDGDDPAGLRDLRAREHVDPDAADAKHRNRVARLHLRRTEHGADPGHGGAADDRRVLHRHVVRQRQHHLLVREDVLGPGVDVGPLELAAAIVEARARHGGVFDRDFARDPRDHHAIALADMADFTPLRRHDAGRLVPEQEWALQIRVMELVELGMTDPRGIELDQDLVRVRVRQLDLLDRQPLSILDVDRRARLHWSPLSTAFCRRHSWSVPGSWPLERGGSGATIH